MTRKTNTNGLKHFGIYSHAEKNSAILSEIIN